MVLWVLNISWVLLGFLDGELKILISLYVRLGCSLLASLFVISIFFFCKVFSIGLVSVKNFLVLEDFFLFIEKGILLVVVFLFFLYFLCIVMRFEKNFVFFFLVFCCWRKFFILLGIFLGRLFMFNFLMSILFIFRLVFFSMFNIVCLFVVFCWKWLMEYFL